MNRFGSLQLKRAKADVAASSTNSVVVAAVPGRVIRVLSLAILCGATGTVATLNSGSTAISMQFQNGANGGAVLPHNDYGWFETAIGEALTLTTGAGTTTGIQVNYVEV